MKALQLTDKIYDYVVAHSPAPSPVLADLARETRSLPGAGMQIAPEQGGLMHLLAKLTSARRIVEVGCYTGYSTISMASALPPGGKLITLDINTETTSVAKRYFAAAGLQDRIELRIGPATESLPKLLDEFGSGSFDMMFIDADKINMTNYYEWGLKLLRQGGLIIGDNVLWGGDVVSADVQDDDTVAIRAFNEHVARDERVERVMLNVADGLFLARKR